MTEKEKFYANEAKEKILQEAGYQCARCGRRAISLAHRIAKSKVNLAKYGKEVIHHARNLVAVCDYQGCNDYFNIGGNPVKTKQLVHDIRADIGWWEAE